MQVELWNINAIIQDLDITLVFLLPTDDGTRSLMKFKENLENMRDLEDCKSGKICNWQKNGCIKNTAFMKISQKRKRHSHSSDTDVLDTLSFLGMDTNADIQKEVVGNIDGDKRSRIGKKQ